MAKASLQADKKPLGVADASATYQVADSSLKVSLGYKQTEVGVIPEDWNSLKLGQVFTFKNGLNKGKEFFGHGTPIVNYMDVYGKHGLLASDIKGLVDVTKLEQKAFDVKKGVASENGK